VQLQTRICSKLELTSILCRQTTKALTLVAPVSLLPMRTQSRTPKGLACVGEDVGNAETFAINAAQV
jgi:hypothetical protein